LTAPPAAPLAGRVPIFDLDGTLLDSDPAILAAFAAVGVPADAVVFGPVLEVECARHRVDPADYLAAYDPTLARPFPGVDEVVRVLPRWAVCSNKRREPGHDALRRAGWTPEVALFSEDFGGPKHLGPVLDALRLGPDEVVFVGDTDHDRDGADAVGCPFVVAGWNARVSGLDGAFVVAEPRGLLDLLGLTRRLG